MLRLFTMKSGGILRCVLENMEMQAKVGKCTGTQKSCLEMGSYDTPGACGIP